MHQQPIPSAWITRFAHLVRPKGRVLDLACGHGRHATWFFERNHPTVCVDTDSVAINSISKSHPNIRCIQADIEAGPWPLTGAGGMPEQFDAVVIANYLWRPLWSTIAASIAPGGVLLMETFAQGNETVGKPSRSDFLLRTGELLGVCQHAALRVVAYEDGFLAAPDRFVQRVAAVKPATSSQAVAPRYGL